jgi:hypothetical protein
MRHGEIIYTSPERQIGKHRWRCQVYAHDSFGACTRYQWWDGLRWRDDEQWPRYNSHDSNSGLPKSLEKLYRQYERDIFAALLKGKEDWSSTHTPEKEGQWYYEQRQKDLTETREKLARLTAA